MVKFASTTLVFTDEEIKKIISMDDAVEAVESCFKEHGIGNATNLTASFDTSKKSVHMKAGFIRSKNLVALKTLGFIVLSDINVRSPLAMMDSTLVTWLRTGAAGAVAARHLARRDSKKIAVIGTGKQGRAQLIGLTRVLPSISTVRAWSPTLGKREVYAEEMSKNLGLDVKAVDTCRDAVIGTDLIVTATWAREPLVKGEWVSPGTHVNAMGADLVGMQELDFALLQKSKIFVDEIDQALKMGAVNVPFSNAEIARDSIQGTLGQVIAKKIQGRVSDDDITVFDSSGIGMQDVALASLAYERRDMVPHQEFHLA